MDIDPLTEKLNSQSFTDLKGKLKHTFLNRAILLLLFLILVMASLDYANQQDIISIRPSIIDNFSLAMSILISYALASIVARLTVNRVMDIFGDTLEPEQRILLSKTYIGLIYALATVHVFIELGIEAQDIVLFLGLIATGFAFAIRDVILSYISWFVLLTKKPFKIGDYIRVEGIEGLVKHIGMFYVLLDDSPETYDDYYKIPNKVFLEKPIHNYGKDKFASSFGLYLKKMPFDISGISLDLDALMDDLNAEVANTFSTKVTLVLDSDDEGMMIRVHYFCSYEEKDAIRDKLLRVIYRSIQDRFSEEKDGDAN